MIPENHNQRADGIAANELSFRQLIELNDRERSHLGQDLHDGICQQLVSIAFATDLLRKDLAAKSPGEAVRAARITALLDNVISHARHLSHALCPVKLSGDGLAVALKSLASVVSREAGISCGAECSDSVVIQDHAVASHLYCIARESVDNAIKFNHPSQVLVQLFEENAFIVLKISDNGVSPKSADELDFGSSLNTIRFRANMAGARLQVRQSSLDGTSITCSFQQNSANPREVATESTSAFTENKRMDLNVI